MDRLDRELTLEIPQNMNLDTFTAHFFNSPSESGTSSKTLAAVQFLNGTAKATITSNDMHQPNRSVVGNQFFQQLGETLFGLGGTSSSSSAASHSIRVSNSEISSGGHSMDLLRNHVVIDSADFGSSSAIDSAANQMQQQLEYDKFMNEIWIGIVLTLIIISMVFCICSCFLYHQFRQWKRNYRHNLQQTQDIESVKLNPETDDPVPEYTLVSGLPSYEAALELMQKTTAHNNGNNSSSSCLIVYPSSLFGAFMVNEKDSLLMSSQSQGSSTAITTSGTEATIPHSPSIGGGAVTATTTTTMTPTMTANVKCQNVSRLVLQQYSIPSYEQAIGYQQSQQQQQQHSDASTCVLKSPPQNWSEDTTKVLLIEKKDEK